MLFLCDQAARGPDLIAAAVPFGNKTAGGETVSLIEPEPADTDVVRGSPRLRILGVNKEAAAVAFR